MSTVQFLTKNVDFQNDLDLTYVKWPFWQRKRYFQGVNMVCYVYLLLFTNWLFCIFVRPTVYCIFTNWQKMRHIRILGRCHHKISVSPVRISAFHFLIPIYGPSPLYHCVRYCTLVFMDVREEKGWYLCTFHLIKWSYPPSCPCYDTLGRVMCRDHPVITNHEGDTKLN